MAWNDDRLALAKKLYIEEGRSAAETAKALGHGFTRNSVIGIAHRRGWLKEARQPASKPKRVIHAPKIKRPAPTPVLGTFVVNGWGKPKATPELQKERSAEGQTINAKVARGGGVESPNARPWMENRKPNECNWTVGDRYEIKFCCNPVHARGWCEGHYALGTVPTAPVRPRAAAAYSRFDRVEKVRPVAANTDRSVWDDARSEAA